MNPPISPPLLSLLFILSPLLLVVFQIGRPAQPDKAFSHPRYVCCRFRSCHRESVGIFLGNEATPEYVTVPYTRVVVTPGIVPDELTNIETDMVSDYYQIFC